MPIPPNRDALIRNNLGLVVHLAEQLAKKLPPEFELDDLIGWGNIGLVRAANRFDRTLGVPFGAYACIRIRGAMLDSMRRHRYEEQTRPRIPRLARARLAAQAPRVDETLMARQQRNGQSRRLRAAIAELPQRSREIVEQFYAEFPGSPATIGAALGMDEWYAEDSRARAITELRRRLSET